MGSEGGSGGGLEGSGRFIDGEGESGTAAGADASTAGVGAGDANGDGVDGAAATDEVRVRAGGRAATGRCFALTSSSRSCVVCEYD